jgi:hypothetical protein
VPSLIRRVDAVVAHGFDNSGYWDSEMA